MTRLAERPSLARDLEDWAGSYGGIEIRDSLTPSWMVAKALSEGGELSDRQRDALARGDAQLVVRPGGKLEVLGAIRGGATGQGAVYARNLPAPGSFVVDPTGFAALTSKNKTTRPQIAHPGLGSSFSARVDAVGIVARIYLIFEGTYTSASTQATLTRQWPWNLAKTVTVSANGINQLFSCQGADLRALMRIRAPGFFNDRESAFVNPTATNATTIRLVWEIPLSFDESLVGSVFAQTEETVLSVNVNTAASGDLFSANAGTFSASTWRIVTEFYSIPSIDTQAGRKLVIPDITQLHGVVSRDDAISAAGTHTAPLTRTGGILLRTLQRGDNTDIGTLDPQTITSHRFRYGGNVVPLDVPGWVARWINEHDYGDAILPPQDVVSGGTAPAYIADDFVVANPARDVIHLAGITEAQMLNDIASTVTVNAGANMHTVQEAMVAG